MLTLKQIYDNKEQIIAGLEKKHFANAAETIEEVIRLDAERKAAQQQNKADKIQGPVVFLTQAGIGPQQAIAQAGGR